jgi:AraC-like DNA-binding protein
MAPAAQTYVERSPIDPLAGIVASAWVQQVAPDAEPVAHRSVPTGGVELVCTIGALPRVVGPATQARVDVLGPGTTLVGLRLRPGAAPALLGMPASELVDTTVEADALWGRAAVALGELVAAAPSPEEALAALQRQTATLVADAPAPDPLVSETVHRLHWRRDDVGALTSELFISERSLRRRVQAAAGLAPKPLHRILRFQAFLALAQYAIAQGRAPSDEGLARLAAAAGYADQPHLNRECVRLTGVAPGTFLGEAEHACSCGHDHAASFTPVLQARRPAR